MPGVGHMRRREFLGALGGAAAAWPLRARAAVGSAAHRPAVADHGRGRYLDAFRHAMRELGYVEGRNIAFAFRFADGQIANLPALANELVALKPAAIVIGSPAASMGKRPRHRCRGPLRGDGFVEIRTWRRPARNQNGS
jgi:putative ABC transport system substrate-binding protein